MKKIRYREAGKTVTLYSPAGRTESFGFTGMFFLPHSAPPYRYIIARLMKSISATVHRSSSTVIFRQNVGFGKQLHQEK